MTFTIRSFDRYVTGLTANQLFQVLTSEFCGRHVSVVYKCPSGIKAVNYISVTEDGVFDTYLKKRITLDYFVSLEPEAG